RRRGPVKVAGLRREGLRLGPLPGPGRKPTAEEALRAVLIGQPGRPDVAAALDRERGVILLRLRVGYHLGGGQQLEPRPPIEDGYGAAEPQVPRGDGEGALGRLHLDLVRKRGAQVKGDADGLRGLDRHLLRLAARAADR